MDTATDAKAMPSCRRYHVLIMTSIAAAALAAVLGKRALPSVPQLPVPTSTPGTLIAIGDIHGDVRKAVQALRMASVIDSSGNWTAEGITVVQLGDLVDRGPSSLDAIRYMHGLQASLGTGLAELHAL